MTKSSSHPCDGTRNASHTLNPTDPAAFILGLIALAFLLHELQWILLPFVLSGLVAFVCTPIVEWLTARLQKPRWISAVIVFIGLLFVVILAGRLIAPPLLHEIAQAVTGIEPLFDGLAKALLGNKTINILGEPMNAPQLAHAALIGVRDWAGHAGRIALIGSSLAAAIFGSVVGFVLLFYFLLSGPQLIKGVLWLAPRERRPLIGEVLRRLDPLLKRYFIGVIVTVFYASFAAYLGLGLVLHVEHALVLAIVTGVLEIIPVFGPAASAILAGLAAIRSATGVGPIIGYAIYAVALRLSIDQFLAPIVLGKAARMNPVIIIFSFFAGGVLFGLIGIILAIPIALTVRVAISAMRSEA